VTETSVTSIGSLLTILRTNAFAIAAQCADVTISCEVLVVIVRVSVVDQSAVVHYRSEVREIIQIYI